MTALSQRTDMSLSCKTFVKISSEQEVFDQPDLIKKTTVPFSLPIFTYKWKHHCPLFQSHIQNRCLSTWRCLISDHKCDIRGSGGNSYSHCDAPTSLGCVSHPFPSLLYPQGDFLEHCLWEDCLKQFHSLRWTHLLVTCRGELNFSVLEAKKLWKLFSCWVARQTKSRT